MVLCFSYYYIERSILGQGRVCLVWRMNLGLEVKPRLPVSLKKIQNNLRKVRPH